MSRTVYEELVRNDDGWYSIVIEANAQPPGSTSAKLWLSVSGPSDTEDDALEGIVCHGAQSLEVYLPPSAAYRLAKEFRECAGETIARGR